MRIAIIGMGQVGSALARGIAGKGPALLLGARNPEADDVLTLARATGAEAMAPEAAARQGDLVFLALPWSAAEAAIATLGALEDKIVVDCMNPLGMVGGALGLTLGHDTSGGEIVQGWLPKAHVVKTLNQIGAELMAENTGLAARPVMFMAGNDPSAKATVATLLNDLGFEALDAGDITRARLLEPLGMLWINQAILRGKGRSWAFAITH